MYHYTDSGLNNVYLANGYDEIETPYGKSVSIHDLDGLHAAIGMGIIERPVMNGDEFRFLRIELGLSQLEVANLFSVGETAVRNWEKGRTTAGVPGTPANLMRALYVESLNTKGRIREILDRISKLNREMHAMEMRLEETDTGWKLAA